MNVRKWVDGSLINELAVLFAWVSVALPWNVMSSNLESIKTIVTFFRFPFFQIRWVEGAVSQTGGKAEFATPIGAYNLQAGSPLADAYAIWAFGALILLIVFIYSVALYFAEEQIIALSPTPPARLIGAFLLTGAVVFTISTYFLVANGFPGTPIPIGIIFLYVFSGILLTNESDTEQTAS